MHLWGISGSNQLHYTTLHLQSDCHHHGAEVGPRHSTDLFPRVLGANRYLISKQMNRWCGQKFLSHECTSSHEFFSPFFPATSKKIDFTNHYFDFTLLNHWTSSHNDRATERGGLISCSHHCGGLRRRRLRGSRVSVNVCACVRACLFVSVCMYLCEHACSHVCMGV